MCCLCLVQHKQTSSNTLAFAVTSSYVPYSRLSLSLAVYFSRVRAYVILHFIFTAELLSLSKANEFWDRVFGPWIHLIYFSESSFACLPETELPVASDPDGCSLTALCKLNRYTTGAIRNYHLQSDLKKNL